MSNSTTNGLTVRNNSLLARLLASENITVVHSHTVQSAAFELNTRTLILPMWKTDKQEVYDFLVGHEVGHALHTPAAEWKAAAERIGGKGNARVAQDFINVVEDARIERMIKRQYPGLRADFKVGYETLQEMDIFQTKGKDIGSMRFIDRLNLHFKVGIHCGVEIPFTAQELAIVNRIAAATTFEQVERLAAEVYEMEKQQKRDQQDEQGNGNAGGEGEESKQDKQSKGNKSDAQDNKDKKKSDKSKTREAGNEDKSQQGQESDDQDGDESSTSGSADDQDGQDGDDDGSTADSSDETDEGRNEPQSGSEDGTDGNESQDDAPEAPSTSQTLSEGMKKFIDFDLVEETIRVRNIDPTKVVIGCDEFIALCDQHIIGHGYARMGKDAVAVEIVNQSLAAFNEMTKNNRRAVDLMCKRFEVKRAAKNFARESSAKTGRISTRLLSKYKFSEDIFDKVVIKRDEKNHGIVIMLDWSGSMSGMIAECADQIGALLLFCRRAGIPAQVFFFTSALVPSMEEEFKRNNPGNKSTRAQASRWGYSQNCNWSQDAEALVFTDHVCNLPRGTTAKGGNAIYQPFSLVKVYDSTMSNSKFQQSFGRFLLISQLNGRGSEFTRNLTVREELMLGTTPLDESILAMRPVIANFRKSSNAKISFLAITDGEGTSLVHGYDNLDTDIKAMKPKKVARVMIDDATGIRFKMPKDSDYANTNDMAVQMLKASTGCSAVGIMLMPERNAVTNNQTFHRAAAMNPEFFKKDSRNYNKWTEAYRAFAEKANEEFEENSVFSMAFGAWDQYFFVGIANSRNAEYEARKEQARLDKMKNRKVAVTRAFISELKRDETNRMFINRLMDIVA